MTHLEKILGVIVCVVLLSSCVSGKKFKDREAELRVVEARNVELETHAATLRAQNSEISAENESLKKEYDQYRGACDKTQAELNALTEILDEEQKTLGVIQEKLEVAMTKFWENDVDVYYKDGLLFVSLADELLFKSGSALLDDDGKQALKSLSVVLNEYPKLKVIVVGNTDDENHKGQGNNWTLSTERANGVVRLLSESYAVDATRLTAAGKGKYNPVATNSTKEGRDKNRRIDIVLNPDIERIWNTAKNGD
jgi:chemotaxis protein MotB